MKILSGFLFLICASAVFAQSGVSVNQSDDVAELAEDSKQRGSVTLNAVHVGDESMSEDEAFEVLKKADIISSVDVGEDGTLSENSFAMASVLYKLSHSDALEFFRKLFTESDTLEGRTYALMGLKLLKENYYYKTLGMTLDSTALVSVYANGKLYEVKMSKFLNAFARKPSVFVPSSFPGEGDDNIDFDDTSTPGTTETHTIIRDTSYVYTDFGTILYPLPAPVVIVTRPPRRPPIVHIRPLPPRPIVPRPHPPRPVLPRPLPSRPAFPRPNRPSIPQGMSPVLQSGSRPQRPPQSRPQTQRPRPSQSRPQLQRPRPPQSRPQMRPVSRPRPSANFNTGGRSSANMHFRR